MNEQPGPAQQPDTDEDSPRFLKVSQVAKALNVSAMTVYREIEDGTIPATQVRGVWRVPASVIDEMVADARRRQERARTRSGPSSDVA